MRVVAQLVEHPQAGAEVKAFLDVVGDHEDGQLMLLPQPQHQLVHVGADARVECAEGLVQQQNARLAEQSLSNRQTLFHAARQLMRVLLQRVAKADFGEDGFGVLPGLLALAAEQVTGQPALGKADRRHDVLQHGHVREHRVLLKHDAAIRAGFGGNRLAVEQQLAAGGRLGAQQHFQKGALAAAGGADQGDELAFLHVDIQALQYHVVAVALADVLDFNHQWAPWAFHGNRRRDRVASSQSKRKASRVIQATYGRITSIDM